MKKLHTRILAFALATLMLALTGCGAAQPVTDPNTEQTAESTGATNDFSTPLAGAAITLKLGHPDNESSLLNTWNAYAVSFKNSLEKYSGGTMTVAIYANDSLGDNTSVVEQCSQGSVDIALSSATGTLAGWVPNVSIFDIPYVVGDMEVNNLVLEGALLDAINEELRPASGMTLLSAIQTGFRNLDTWNAPIRSPEEMKGLKFRLQEIDSHIAMAEAWGAIPTTVSFSELYSAIQTNVIDAAENCNYTLFMKRLEEVTKYITDTQHLANVCCALISNKTMDKLSAEQQGWILKAAGDARIATIGAVTLNDVNITAALNAAGVQLVSLSDAERAAFKDACYESCKSLIVGNKVSQEFYDLYMAEYAKAAAVLGK